MARPKRKMKRPVGALSKSLRLKIFLSGTALNIERLIQAFWPSMTVLLTAISLMIWQAHAVLPPPYDLGLYGGLAAWFLWFFIKGLLHFKPATRDQAILRLDANATGNPVIALVDRQVSGADDEASKELWQLHQQRMAQVAELVEVPAPHVRLAKRDPWAIRLVVLLFFGSAIFFGRANSGQSMLETLQDLASGTTGVEVSYEAWAEPPVYTGLPTLYLNKIKQDIALDLPQGTRLILRSYGAKSLTVESDVATLTDDQKVLNKEAVIKISKSGALVLKKGYRTVAGWNITMIPDTPPTVALTGDISHSIQGSVQIPYAAKDDYGIIGGKVEITLDMAKLDRRHGLALAPENTKPISFDLALPFNADPKDFKETAIKDLAEHPWAGLPVKISLSVEDAAGHVAYAKPVFMPMPGKRFFDPLAAAIAEQRRDLLWNRRNIKRVDMILKALTYLPEQGFTNARAYLMVRSVIARIGYTPTRPIADAVQKDMAQTLWHAALLIEDGDLSDAAARLKRAQDRLSEAMRNGATKDEIAQLMDELRKATDAYMRQLAENAKPRDAKANNGNTRQITRDMLQKMMDQIQQLMEQGRMAEAQALLDQLHRMMQNMQVTQGGGKDGKRGQQGQQGLQDTLRQQQDLADENFQQMQREFSKNQGAHPKTPQGTQKDGSDQGDNQQSGNQNDLAKRQEALRQLMGQQLQQLSPDDSAKGQAGREALRDAERQMGAARDNLKQGRGAEALNNQADAVDALRKGLRKLNEANRRAGRGQNRDGKQNGETAGPDGKDPLGRSAKDRGRAVTNEKLLQSDMQLRRSKEILKEIRRRSGERTRPQLELDYLDRLLQRF